MEEVSYEALINKSMATLKRTKAASIGLLSSGSLAFLTNSVIFLLVWRSKKLRKGPYALIAQLAFADWLVGVAYMITGIKRLIRLANGIHEVNSQVWCCAEMWLAYFRYSLSSPINYGA